MRLRIERGFKQADEEWVCAGQRRKSSLFLQSQAKKKKVCGGKGGRIGRNNSN